MAQEHRSLIALTLVLCAAVLLSGCPSRSVREPQPGIPAQTTDGSPLQLPAPSAPSVPLQRVPPPPRENHLSPATRSLVTQAHAQSSKGDLDGASSTLDRALRIEPNNPLLWIERGRLRLAESDARQAESCGRKALALASGDRATQKQAGQLLADALRAEKRNQEAHEVESQPFMH